MNELNGKEKIPVSIPPVLVRVISSILAVLITAGISAIIALGFQTGKDVTRVSTVVDSVKSDVGSIKTTSTNNTTKLVEAEKVLAKLTEIVEEMRKAATANSARLQETEKALIRLEKTIENIEENHDEIRSEVKVLRQEFNILKGGLGNAAP